MNSYRKQRHDISDSKKQRFIQLYQFSGFNPELRYDTNHVIHSTRFFNIDCDSPILQPDRFDDLPRSILDITYTLAANHMTEIDQSDVDLSGFIST